MKRKKMAIFLLALLLLTGILGVSASATELGKHADSASSFSIKVFSRQAPTWQQVNEDGFGDPDAEEVSALAAFNGSLYAATSNPMDGARIFRSEDGVTWTPVTLPGFGIAHDIAPPTILDLTVFNGRIYASSGRGDGPGQIWRALDGVNWAPMVIHGFSDPDIVDINPLTEFNSLFYAGAKQLVNGAQVWRSYTGDSNSWTQVAPAVPGTDTASVTGMAVFDNAIYAAVESGAPAQVWRSYGSAWATIISDGFGDPLTTSTGGMAAFGGYLYIGGGSEKNGAQLWRSDNGSTWDPVIDPGFGDPNNQKVELVFVFENMLYLGVQNQLTGIEIWRSPDVTSWEQVNLDGFGDLDNASTNGSNAVAEFLGDLYVGTANLVDGGELWRLEGGSPQPPPTQPPPTQEPTPVYQYLPFTLRWP